MLLPPALLLRPLAPGLLLVRTTLLRLRSPPLLRRSLLTTLTGLRTPTTLLGRLPMRRLAVRRLALRRLTMRGLALRRLTMRRVSLVRRLSLLRWPLTPSAALRRGLLSPTALLRRPSVLSPVLPAWLAPRLPRTPWPLRRRRHICSF